MKKKNRAKLCPNCRKLISADEKKCPYCKTVYPHFWLKHFLIKMYKNEGVLSALILMNVFMFSASILFDISKVSFDINPLAFLSPGNESLFWLGATGCFPIDSYKHWWSLITANYLHGGLLHLFLNMLALNQIGSLIVREFGAIRFWTIYTASGVIGFMLSWFMGVDFTIGASAAVCGLIGAGLYFGKSQGGAYGHTVYRNISGWVISLFLFGFIVPGINNWAHAGGLIGGILFAYILGYDIQPKHQKIHRTLAILCISLTLFCLLWVLFYSAYVLSETTNVKF
ncbi:protease [Candidatus Magnetomorum sp. HK-1]|nr:protease [Candidatus Magnetomorum sp. HK-1]